MSISDAFIRYLRLSQNLTAGDVQQLRAVEVSQISLQPGQMIAARDLRPNFCGRILQGMAAQSHLLYGPTGGRVITALHMPGDFLASDALLRPLYRQDIISVDHCRVELVEFAPLCDLMMDFPDLIRLLWAVSAAEAAISRKWLEVAASRRSSSHLAHLLCEIYTRLAAIDQARDHQLTLPLMQREIAQILGYSPIHINRAIRQLRDQSLLQWEGRAITILDWKGLCDLAHFDASYLQLFPFHMKGPVIDTAANRLSGI